MRDFVVEAKPQRKSRRCPWPCYSQPATTCILWGWTHLFCEMHLKWQEIKQKLGLSTTSKRRPRPLTCDLSRFLGSYRKALQCFNSLIAGQFTEFKISSPTFV